MEGRKGRKKGKRKEGRKGVLAYDPGYQQGYYQVEAILYLKNFF